MNIDRPSASDVPALRALWREAFGDGEEFLDAFFCTAFSPERARCVRRGTVPVGALYWFDCICRDRRIAYLYAVATAEAYRGQGISTALLEDTHRYLCELGYAGAILVPGGEELFSFYRKRGYEVCSRIGEFRCRASAEGASLRELGVAEYAALRRTYLPENAVIQENENLTFLQAQAKFYTGDGFLLAARREKDTLFGIELLGDPTVAPAVLTALGCAEGRFRTPGNDRPFAMYHAFADRAPSPPDYFGIAFD